MTAFLPRPNLTALLLRLSLKMEIIAPVRAADSTVFATWDGQEISSEPGPAAISPATLFLPKREVLFRYVQYSGEYVFEAPSERKRMVMGIRPCDLRAVTILDKLFSDDSLYQSRRRSTLVAAQNCTTPGDACNCMNMGCGPECLDSCDLLFTDLESGFLVDARSKAGEGLIQENLDLFEEADESMLARRDELIRAAGDGCRSGPTLQQIKDDMAKANWDELTRECLVCGGCTFACPVCHCFNILDLGVPDGERIRCRDSCTLSGFFRMAGGANPRRSQGERMRNWYVDKFELIPQKTGMPGCVGCGRCSRACLAGFDRPGLGLQKL